MWCPKKDVVPENGFCDPCHTFGLFLVSGTCGARKKDVVPENGFCDPCHTFGLFWWPEHVVPEKNGVPENVPGFVPRFGQAQFLRPLFHFWLIFGT